MVKLLQIQGSPREARSRSRAVADAFIDAYGATNDDDEVEEIDIWSMPLPDFDGAMLNAKYTVLSGDSPSGEQQAAWGDVQQIFDQFNSADKYLLTVPMWNFGIPYRLKQYIDIITQPGMAWSYTPEEGYSGLLEDKAAAVIYARGDRYGQGTGLEDFDLQQPYVSRWLNFVGISDITEIKIEGTLFPDEDNEEEGVIQQAMEIASTF